MWLVTCFLNEGTLYGGAGLNTAAHHVHGEGAEHILVPHDEVRHHTVGASVLVVNRVPVL